MIPTNTYKSDNKNVLFKDNVPDYDNVEMDKSLLDEILHQYGQMSKTKCSSETSSFKNWLLDICAIFPIKNVLFIKHSNVSFFLSFSIK